MADGPDLWTVLEAARKQIADQAERITRLEARQNLIWTLGAAVIALAVAVVRQQIGV